jgi:nucleoid-associated protein YgaU
MGVFDFIRNIGKSILPGNEGPAIQADITKLLGSQVDNLKVEYDDGLVRLSGLVDSVAAKQKAVLLAGNVKGVEKVNDDGLQVKPQPPAAPPEPEFTFYTIVSGDSLSKIAKKYYGDAMKWKTLFEANREVIQNADLIYPGQVIRVPKSAG